MQSSGAPMSPQESHVSFSNIEEKRQFPAEQPSKINQHMKRELKLWDDLFIDLTQILTRVAPYPPTYIQTNDDKRAVLKQLCEFVTSKAENPTESPEYQTLEKNLQECKNKIEELKSRCQQISEQLNVVPQEIPLMKEKITLDHKLENLEEILKRQVKSRKNELMKEKNKVHRRKRSDQASDTSSVYKNTKGRGGTDFEKGIPKFASAPLFTFDKSFNEERLNRDSLLAVTDDENDFSIGSFG